MKCYHGDEAKVCASATHGTKGSTFWCCPRGAKRGDPNGCGFFQWKDVRHERGEDERDPMLEAFPIFHESC